MVHNTTNSPGVEDNVANLLPDGIEKSSQPYNTEVALNANPKVGLYTSAPIGAFAECGYKNVTLKELNKIGPSGVGAYASSSYYPASNAIDGSEVTFWLAYGGGE